MSAWVRMVDRNEWVAEVSEIQHEAQGPRCPNCERPANGPWQRNDEGGETVKWTRHCACGHMLTIIND